MSIDADPQHAQLTDRQKMDLAKERVADEVRAQLATDPELLAVNAMAAKLGDAQLFNLVTRGTAKTVKSGIVRNATEQGAINAAQGGYSRYQENTALRETAGMGVSPWRAWLTQRSKVQPLVLRWGSIRCGCRISWQTSGRRRNRHA